MRSTSRNGAAAIAEAGAPRGSWITATLLPAALLASPLLGAAAAVDSRLTLVALAGGAYLLVASTNLMLALAIFTIPLFLEPGVITSEVALKLAGALLFAAFVVRCRPPFAGVERGTRSVVTGAGLLFVCVAGASAAWADNSTAAREQAFRLLQAYLLFVLVVAICTTYRRLRTLLRAYVAGAMVSIAVGLTGTRLLHVNPYAGTGRFVGGIADPNELAAFLLPAGALAVALAITARTGTARVAAAGSVAAITAAFIATESRGGLVGLAVAALTALLVARESRLRIALCIGVVLLSVSGFYAYIAGAGARDRIESTLHGDSSGRTDLWRLAVHLAEDHPIAGIGSGNFVIADQAYTARDIDLPRIDLVSYTPQIAHNTYLEVFAELGVVGLLVFVVVLVGTFANAFGVLRALERAGPRDQVVVMRALIAGCAGAFTAFLFLSGEYEKHLWLLLGMLCAATPGTARRAD